MPKFKFAYQRVLEYRKLQESWAKDAFVAAKRCKRAAELVAEKILQERDKAMMRLPQTIEEMKTLDFYFEKLQCDYENQLSVITILQAEEDKANAEWIETKRRLKAMERLYEVAWSQHQVALNREEQKQLDEWTNFRRAA